MSVDGSRAPHPLQMRLPVVDGRQRHQPEPVVPFKLTAAASLGKRVRLARIAADLTPEAVATALGLSYESYHRSERGQRPWRRGELIVVAMLTGQDPLLFGVIDHSRFGSHIS